MAESGCGVGVAEVLDFWFGPLDERGLANGERRSRWWRKDEAFDTEIRERFLPTWERARQGGLDAWKETPLESLALVVVLDQLPRNMFRGSAEMFASDTTARRVCLEGIDARRDAELVGDHGAFFYMPLMHGERRSDQHLGTRMFEQLVARSPEAAREAVAGNLGFMRRHFEIVDRFGRFPHRNALLGRASTQEELEFLEQPGSSF